MIDWLFSPLLDFGFMRRALVAGLALSLVAPTVKLVGASAAVRL